MPLGEFDRDTLWPVDEDELPRMEIHDLVSRVETVRLQLRDLLLDGVDREADVVHADLVQVADMRVRQGSGMPVSQQLNLGARRYVLQNQRYVIRLDAGYAHIARERLPGDDHRHPLLETENGEKFLRLSQVPHHDRQMV